MNTKLKKCCPNCSQLFNLKSLNTKQSVDKIPLLLKCGHSVCENCITNLVKFAELINCKVCHKDMEITANELALLLQNKLKLHQLFPVNIYMLGELSLEVLEMKIEEKHNDEDYFLNLEALLRNEDTVQGQCLECHNTTTKMCQQCSTILCDACFNKSHKNFVVFRNHILQNIEPKLSMSKCITHTEKPLDYYCKDCSKSICMDCLVVGGEKSCKNHNLVSTQEVNEEILEELAEISPKVDETFRRLTKTAVGNLDLFNTSKLITILTEDPPEGGGPVESVVRVFDTVKQGKDRLQKFLEDIGHLLHNIANDTGTSDLTHLANEVEHHFSKLMSIIQAQKKEITNKVILLKRAEKESLEKAKSTLADSIAKARSVVTAINKSLSVDKMKQANMSALLEDAKKVVSSPWYLNKNRIPINLVVNEEVCDRINEYLYLEGDSNGTYELLSTEELDPGIEIPPPPPAPVYPPELPKDVRQKNKPKVEKEKDPPKSQSFYKRAPTYRSKSGSVSSLNSDSSHKSNGNTYRDEGYQKPIIQSVSPFPESKYPKQLQAGGQELIYISHIVTPHNFFVQRACHQSMVEEILKEFRNAVSLPTPSIAHISEGKFYLVFNKADNFWLRCRVVSIDRTNINKPLFHVFCIDFGSTEVVPIDKLRLLPPARVQSPFPFAINCSLTNCEPVTGSWTTDDALLIQNITDNKQAVMHIHRIRSTSNYSVSIECDVTTFEGAVSLSHALAFHGRARMPNPRLPYPKNRSVVTKPKLFVINNDFKPKSVEEVYITHIVSPDNFYVRKQHFQDVYEKLCEELDQNYSLSVNTGTIYLPELEMVCVANVEKYVIKDANTRNVRATWARAIVKELPGRGRVRLLLPDCGASVLAHWSVLRRIQPAFTKLKGLATECHLAGVTPMNKKWSPNSVCLLQKFRDRLLELYVEDNSGHSLGVTLTDKNDPENITCINSEMVRYKFAISFGLFSFNKQNVVEESVITNKLPLEQTTPYPKPKTEMSIQILKKEQPSKPKEAVGSLEAKDKGPLRLEAKVLHYQSPSLIYMSLIHQQKTFNVLYENIQKHYSKNKSRGKDNWVIGDRCCTVCQQSQTWRRAVILELEGENAKVFYSDFACIETVPISNLRELTEDFSSIGYAAIKCHLCGVIPADREEWPTITKEYLKEMLDVYKRVFITKFGNFKDKSMPVEIWVYHTTQGGALEANISEWRCLNHKIIEQGLGIPDKINPPSTEAETTSENTLSFLNVTGSVEEWLQLEPLPTKPLLIKSDSESHSNASTPIDAAYNTDDANKPDTMFISDWMPPEPLQNQEFTAVPTYVDNDGVIYLHDVSQQDTLDLIRKALDVRFKNPDPKAKYAKWSVDEPCIALYYLDDQFYRGRIIEVNNETSTCTVHYIDFGNEESCAFTNLRKSIALYQIPTQAHKCVLHKIQPIGKHWERQTLDYMHKSIVEKNCYVKLCGPPIDGIYPIELKYDKLLINDHLVEFEMAEYSDGSKPIVRKYAPEKNKYDDTKNSVAVESDSGPDYIVEEEQEDLSTSHDSYDMKRLEGKDWNTILMEDEEKTSGKERYFTFKVNVDKEFVCNITVINNMNTLELNVVYSDEVMEEYEKMFEKLQETANDMPPLNGIFENKACVAIFDEDGRWYRASILEYSEEKGRIKVRYVDYGNIEIISLAEAKEIDEEFIKLPPLTVPAALHGIEINPDVNLNVLTKEYEKKFLDKGPFHANVIDFKNGVPCVVLTNEDGDLVYEDLIENMIFLRSDMP